jgi:hypothetical protein
MTLKKVYFKGLKEEVLARSKFVPYLKQGTKCLPTFVTKQRKPKPATRPLSQLMTTDYLAFEVIS